MLRWERVSPVTLWGMKVKMYRPLFVPDKTIKIQNLLWEFDHYAYKFLGTELDMYKILDTNFIDYMENRGDVSKMNQIEIPISEKEI